MTPRWQRAPLTPSWIRWLPCAFAYLTVVPDPVKFRRSAWDGVVPWHDAAWCDPGGVREWVDRARRRHPRQEASRAESHAREHYEWMVQVRAARIDLFTEMCRRSGLPAPHTVLELFTCLTALGLFELTDEASGDPWVLPRLDQDPLRVLPFSGQEWELEVQAQREDRAVQVAIAVRRLAQRTRRRWRHRLVTTSLTGLAELAGVPSGEVRRSLDDLTELTELTVLADGPDDPAGWVRVSVPWPGFRLRFPYDELPAPEHAV